MQSLSMIKDLFKHMHWADSTIWKTVLTISDTDINDGLKNLLYHLHITQYAFYHIWANLSMEFPKKSDFKTIQEVANWASNYPNVIQSYITDLQEKDLNKVIHIPWSERLEAVLGRKPAESNLAETLIQVTAHSSYHRGQVNRRIREIGIDPPMVDFIAWVWLGKPEAVWSVTK